MKKHGGTIINNIKRIHDIKSLERRVWTVQYTEVHAHAMYQIVWQNINKQKSRYRYPFLYTKKSLLLNYTFWRNWITMWVTMKMKFIYGTSKRMSVSIRMNRYTFIIIPIDLIYEMSTNYNCLIFLIRNIGYGYWDSST